MCAVLHKFDRQRLTDNMGLTYRGVVGKDENLLTRELASVAPRDRVFVHRQTRVAGVIDQRVAHCLKIPSERPRMEITMNLTIDAVRIDMEGLQA